MTEINIGIVGGGYMGKAHASAFASVGTIFQTRLKPRLHTVCASSPESAERYKSAFGFQNAAANWQQLVDDPDIEAVVIASPQETHREIAEAALSNGKHVLCEKPLGATLEDCISMAKTARANSGLTNLVGFNYMKTPVTQHAVNMVQNGELGKIVSFRCEHIEDFMADPAAPATWRNHGVENGCMGDLAPHPINLALTFMGPVSELSALIETVHQTRPGDDGPVEVTNDDQVTMILKFENGVTGSLHSSRVATGTKMGITYEIVGTRKSLRFNQEDQNCLHIYDTTDKPTERGYRRVLSGPQHPDYVQFNLGEGHGTGYVDQIVMQAAAFLKSIDTGAPAKPDFADGLAVARVVDAAFKSSQSKSWVSVETDRF
jgi:predicted dehydrogenase